MQAVCVYTSSFVDPARVQSEAASDIRGGSLSQDMDFSQMLQDELDQTLAAEAEGVAEPSQKRSKTGDRGDANTANTLSQLMQTDFDISTVPEQSSSRPSAQGSILKEIGDLERMIAA